MFYPFLRQGIDGLRVPIGGLDAPEAAGLLLPDRDRVARIVERDLGIARALADRGQRLRRLPGAACEKDRVSPGFMPFSTNGFAGVVTTSTPSSVSVTAGIVRSPAGDWPMNAASEGESSNRQASFPFGRVFFATCSTWVLPAFEPVVTW